jgi:hypothetical protein
MDPYSQKKTRDAGCRDGIYDCHVKSRSGTVREKRANMRRQQEAVGH